MMRIALMVAATTLVAGAAQAQGLSGDIWSHMPTGFHDGFSGNINSGFQSGLGARDAGRRAQTGDFTLGSSGALQPVLLGQPSNFGPSVEAMSPLQDTQLTFDNGPQTSLDPGIAAGPLGPMD